jgi:hypothetical protein
MVRSRAKNIKTREALRLRGFFYAQRNTVTFDKKSSNIYSSFRPPTLKVTANRGYCMEKELLKPVTVSNAKPGDKDKRLNDDNGLYLLIKPAGAKWWRFDCSNQI